MRAGITLLLSGAVALTLTACQTQLLASTSEFDSTGGGAGSSQTAPSETSEEEKSLAVGGQDFASVSECLVGMWDIDPQSFAEMVGKASGQPGDITVQGVAEIDFQQTDFVANYVDWQVIFADPEGTITQTTNGKETGQWSVDSSNLLSSTTISDTTQSTLKLDSPQGSMVLPTGVRDEVGVEYTDFVVTCEADTARLDSSDGYLVLNRR